MKLLPKRPQYLKSKKSNPDMRFSSQDDDEDLFEINLGKTTRNPELTPQPDDDDIQQIPQQGDRVPVQMEDAEVPHSPIPQPISQPDLQENTGVCLELSCQHPRASSWVCCDICSRWFHKRCVCSELSMDEKNIMELEESEFICKNCGEEGISLPKEKGTFKYSQLSPQTKRVWKREARRRGKRRD